MKPGEVQAHRAPNDPSSEEEELKDANYLVDI